MPFFMRCLLIGLISLLSACTTTGNYFHLSGIHQLQVGQTTQQQAIALLQAEPVNYYHQSNGTYLALWRFTRSMLTDAIYIDRELLLEFDANQRLLAIKKQPPVYDSERQAVYSGSQH
ncbi:hypothetical protein ACBP46_04455 [Paenalcaligenes hominis]|uniref:hypothetical protein n=1 Tax=Paenalcaligenes hominis TaxID=643674 RepID=UPI00352445C2